MQQDSEPRIGPKVELAEHKLGENLGAWARGHRNDDRSWRWIADRLASRTGVTVTPEWLRQLYAAEPADAESGAA